MKVKKHEKIAMSIVIAFLFVCMISVFVSAFVGQILVKKMGVHNAFTKFVFMYNEESDNVAGLDGAVESDDVTEFEKKVSGIVNMMDDIRKSKHRIDVHSSKMLWGYKKITEASREYEDVIGWNFASYSEYNSVVRLSDGYWTELISKEDVMEHTDSVASFRDWCIGKGIDFLYIQAPYKVSKYQDEISGKLDFSNQNADELVSRLRGRGVDVYDVREDINAAGYDYHGLFFRTDHHWRPETGLWASKMILNYCNDKYGFHADTDLLEEEQFEKRVYHDWFLGAQGKKVTLERTDPEDITLLYPKYDVKFHYSIPDAEIDEIGDYSIIYNMDEIEVCDYYNKSPYHAYNYGDRTLIRIQNLNDADDKKILIIHDSFGDCVISCLALCEKNVDAIDLRLYSGSVRNYIEDTKPDVVMILYNAGYAGGRINKAQQPDLFDFR